MVYMPPTIPGVVPWWVYTSLPYLHYTTLGTPSHPVHCRSLYYTSTLLHAVQDEGALGSRWEIPLGREPLRTLRLSFLLLLVGSSAQSYSASLRRTDV